MCKTCGCRMAKKTTKAKPKTKARAKSKKK